jgi:hypothetical protein
VVDHVQRERFYAAAIIGLRALEAREGRARRFGPDADATWAAFAGTLHDRADRLELLLRDAAVGWGLAFDARAIFDLPATASDDPFGTSWRHGKQSILDDVGEPTLEAAAAALGFAPSSFALPELSATTRLVVGGPSAMVAAARAIHANPALGWDRQVTVIADAPGHRQLAGLCALFAGSEAPTRVRRSAEPLPPGTRLASSDAEPAVRRALETP